MEEFDVTIVEADLTTSRVTGHPVCSLMFLPHGLCFCDGRAVSRLFNSISNVHSALGAKRTALRSVLGMVVSDSPFVLEELSAMVGRCLRVQIESVEFQGRVCLRVVGFLGYSGVVKNALYSDNEYVFMIGLLQREGVSV